MEGVRQRGEDIEFNRLVNRTSSSLPPAELKLKVVKVSQHRVSHPQESNGSRTEIKRLAAITMAMPKIFVLNDSFFFLAEMRNSKMNFLSQWMGCVVQLTRYQLRVFRSVADVPMEKTVLRVNLSHLMVGVIAGSDG